MIKLVIGFERQPNISRAQCHDHLRNAHAPLVASVEEFSRYLKRYVQNFAIGDASRNDGSGFDVDAVAQLWFQDAEEFAVAFAQPRYLELIRPDELRFANPERLLICACADSAPQWDDGDAGALKFFRFLVPRADGARISGGDDYAALIGGSPELRKVVRKYVRNLPAPEISQVFPSQRPIVEVQELYLSEDMSLDEFIEMERQSFEGSDAMNSNFDIEKSVIFAGIERIVVGN